jgi:hypothetical protein
MTNSTICAKAREMLSVGYTGQNMRDPERAALYIQIAADTPNVEDDLPETGRSFWKSADFHYRIWKKKQPISELDHAKQTARADFVKLLEQFDELDITLSPEHNTSEDIAAVCVLLYSIKILRDELMAWATEKNR